MSSPKSAPSGIHLLLKASYAQLAIDRSKEQSHRKQQSGSSAEKKSKSIDESQKKKNHKVRGLTDSPHGSTIGLKKRLNDFSCPFKNRGVPIRRLTEIPRTEQIAEKSSKKVKTLYGSGKLKFKEKDLMDRYRAYQTKPIFNTISLDIQVLQKVNLDEKVNDMLSMPEWRFLLMEFKEDIYPDLLQEVLTTMQITSGFDTAPTSAKTISFKVGKDSFQLSLDELSKHMGFDALQNLPPEEMNKRLCSVPDMQTFWREIVAKPSVYKPSRNKSTEFATKELKLIHYILSHSICGRRQASGSVTTTDLLCLYSIVKRVPIHMGYVLGMLFHSHRKDTIDTLYLGPYLTRVLKDMGEHRRIWEQPCGHTMPITEQDITRIFTHETVQKKKRARIQEQEGEWDNDEEMAEAEAKANDDDEVEADDDVAGTSVRTSSRDEHQQHMNPFQQVLAHLGSLQTSIDSRFNSVDSQLAFMNSSLSSIDGRAAGQNKKRARIQEQGEEWDDDDDMERAEAKADDDVAETSVGTSSRDEHQQQMSPFQQVLAQLESLQTSVDSRFNSMDSQLAFMNSSLTSVDGRVTGLEMMVREMYTRLPPTPPADPSDLHPES